MTLEKAIQILDPATTREALASLSDDAAIIFVEEACRVAVDVMRDKLETEAKT